MIIPEHIIKEVIMPRAKKKTTTKKLVVDNKATTPQVDSGLEM